MIYIVQHMKQFKQTYIIDAATHDVWKALVDPKVIADWGAGPASMSDKKEKFSLWGGDIYGTNTEIHSGHMLAQDWYGGDWAEPSHVTIELASEDDKTTITLTHTNIPDDEFEGIKSGWKDYYFGPMKELLEM